MSDVVCIKWEAESDMLWCLEIISNMLTLLGVLWSDANNNKILAECDRNKFKKIINSKFKGLSSIVYSLIGISDFFIENSLKFTKNYYLHVTK